jgi:hypothetical protein
MGFGAARQCSRNRCLPRWTVWIPHRGRRGGADRANSKKDLLTGPIRGFCAVHADVESRRTRRHNRDGAEGGRPRVPRDGAVTSQPCEASFHFGAGPSDGQYPRRLPLPERHGVCRSQPADWEEAVHPHPRRGIRLGEGQSPTRSVGTSNPIEIWSFRRRPSADAGRGLTRPISSRRRSTPFTATHRPRPIHGLVADPAAVRPSDGDRVGPIVPLNRAIAAAEVEGPRGGARPRGRP